MQHQSDSDNKTSSTSRATLYLVFYLTLGLALTWMFNSFLDNKHNPNQQLQSHIDEQGIPTVVLIRNDYGHYVSNGKINQHDVQFFLDTGATSVSIPSTIARDIGLKKGAPFQVSTANGSITVYATEIQSIELGDIKLYNIFATINPHMDGDDILLGMTFLKHLEFTQRGKQLTLRQY